jgi:hypothetical protein
MILSELQKYIRREVTRHQILENLKQAKEYLKGGKLTDEELKSLLEIDPTKQKKYVGWMAKKWIEGGKQEADARQLANYIPTYDKLVSTNKIDERDINKFKAIKDLVDKIEVIQSTGQDITTSSLEKDADVILDNEDLLIMSPHTHEASRKLGLSVFAHRKCKEGKDSAWCTTYKSPDHFNDYYYDSKVTFYYTKVLSQDIMEKLQQAFPKRYQAMVVIAFAVIPEGKKTLIDAYDGKDKQLPKKDLSKVIEILGVSQYLKPARVEGREKKKLQAILSKIKKYADTGAKDEQDFDFSEIKVPFTLPENLTVINGNLDLTNSNIDRLPPNLQSVKGELDLSGTKIKELPSSLKFVEFLYINEFSKPSGLTKLPENFKCDRLVIVGSNISEIPASITVKDLSIRFNNKIKSLPSITCDDLNLEKCDGIRTIGNVNDVKDIVLESCKNLTTLPSVWKGGILSVTRCPKVTQVPTGKYRRLHIDECPNIKSLPDGIQAQQLETGDLLPREGVIGEDQPGKPGGQYGVGNDYITIPSNVKELSPKLIFKSSTHITINNSQLRNLPYGQGFELDITKAPYLTNDSFPKQKQKISTLGLFSPNITQIPSNITIGKLILADPKKSKLQDVPKGLKKLDLHYRSLVAQNLYVQFPALKKLASKMAGAWSTPKLTDKEADLVNKAADSLGIRPAASWNKRIEFSDISV